MTAIKPDTTLALDSDQYLDQYLLTEPERTLIDELLANARALEQQAQGALRMICKIHGLEGQWNYNEGRLTKATGPPASQTALSPNEKEP
jgi:hypothetical protein